MRTISKHSGRIEVRPALKAINQIAAAWAAAYQSACEYDKIPKDSRFTVFSNDNPFAQFIDAAHREYCAMRQEYEAGGYVGLRMG